MPGRCTRVCCPGPARSGCQLPEDFFVSTQDLAGEVGGCPLQELYHL